MSTDAMGSGASPDETILQARSRMESDASEGVRREGGLLVQTGLLPEVFSALREKLGFREGYRQMIVDAWRKYLVNEESLPENGTPEYDALAQFLHQPDVFRQIFVLQNHSFTGTTFMRPAQEVLNEVGTVAGFNDDGTIKNKDLTLLFGKIREAKFEADKNRKFADELGLTKDDIEQLTTTPGKHKEYATEVSYGVKSKPADLLADKNSVEVFSFLSSPLSTEYVRDSLRSIRDYLKSQIETGAVPMSDRAKQFALAGFLPLLDNQGTLNDQARVRLRNVLWAMQSYGICSIETVRDKQGGLGVLAPRINRKEVSIEGDEKKREMGVELFVRYIESFLSGDQGGDTGKGTNVIDRQTLEWVVDGKKEAGELATSDKKAIERFLEKAGNPIYLSITRLTRGGRRPTIGKMIGVSTEPEPEEELPAGDQDMRSWDSLTAQELAGDEALSARQFKLLEKTTERAHVESRRKSFVALQALFISKGSNRESAVQDSAKKGEELLARPVNASLAADARTALLKEVGSAHQRVLDLYNKLTVEFESVRTEIRKQRGVRWDKKKKNWDSPTRPETHFSKALQVFERSIKAQIDSPEIVTLKSVMTRLEQEKRLLQTTLPAAQRSMSLANDAIAKYGAAKDAQVAEIRGVISALEERLQNRDVVKADELVKDLDTKAAKIVPATEARRGREAMRKSKEKTMERNAFVDQIRAGGAINIPGYPKDQSQWSPEQKYRESFYRTIRREIFEGIAGIRNKKGHKLTSQSDATVQVIRDYIRDNILQPIIAEDVATFVNSDEGDRKNKQDALRAKIKSEIADLIEQLREMSG